MNKLKLAFASLALLGASSSAMAFSVTADTGSNLDIVINRPLNENVSLTTHNTATEAVAGDGTLTIRAKGDFDGNDEWLNITSESNNLAVTDVNTSENNGLYLTNGQFNVFQVATVTIPQAILAAITADGSAVINFNIPSTADAGWVQVDSIKLDYATTPVPVPAALPLLGSGLMFLWGANARRKKKSEV
ncbi:MAG: PEP-CTERM sorting domain-containing protein [bacterium]